MIMNLRVATYDLQLKHTFTISRSARKSVPVVFCEFEHDGIIGRGESSPSSRYNESVQTVLKFFEKINLKRFGNEVDIPRIMDYINQVDSGNSAAKAAIDISIHDWIGKKEGVPLWKKWNLDKSKIPITSFTIGIDSPDLISQKVKEAEEYPILKVKLGVADDLEIIKIIRKHTSKLIRVDANEGWKIKEEALEKIMWLVKQNIELIEQPMPATQLDDIKWLHERAGLPLIADESVSNSADIKDIAGYFDGINIKLMKAGGLREAYKMIEEAKKNNLKIMLGCMIESSLAISAAAQLLPFADYADLDGNLLISNDPFDGVKYQDGYIKLSDEPGLGVTKRL
ncbi:MAG: dipeptide epimerase [Ignavibacteriales bacterium]|nr:dipeptide epimerase [Ignavibacteriales bacterium]